MNSEPSTQERLRFLIRVVEKEITHLDYAKAQVFNEKLTLQAIEALESNPELALQIEAFSSRFFRLQDTLGDKFLPALLSALGEARSALLVNLDKAEKFGWLESREQWLSMRHLRNQMIHEYIENPRMLFDALNAAEGYIAQLKAFADQLIKQAACLF